MDSLIKCKPSFLITQIIVSSITATCWMFISPSLHAQASVATDPLPEQDVIAVTALKQSLSKMGGADIWLTIHSVSVEGTVIGPPPQQVSWTFKWDDDWTTGRNRFRHETNTGSDIHIRTGDPSQGSFFKRKGNVSQLSPFADIGNMPVHLPAAMISIILASPASEIVSVPCVGMDFPQDVCIRTQTTSHGVPVKLTKQEWFLNPSTQLPDAVRVELYNSARPSSPIPRMIKYLHFSMNGKVLVPDQMQISIGNSYESLKLSAPIINQPFSDSNFVIAR